MKSHADQFDIAGRKGNHGTCHLTGEQVAWLGFPGFGVDEPIAKVEDDLDAPVRNDRLGSLELLLAAARAPNRFDRIGQPGRRLME
jgi:hypothetical protein